MKLQKRLAAQALSCGINRVAFDPSKIAEIKEAITSFDIKRLINKGYIGCAQIQGVSRARAKKTATQKSKGRQSGHGSRKGKANARLPAKHVWINNVRAQRTLAKTLKDKKIIDHQAFNTIYAKIKGGFFRSAKHIKLYIEEQDLIARK